MKTASILAPVLLLALVVSCCAEESDITRKLEKLRKLKPHSAETEAVAYKSDGLVQTSFKPDDILKFHADRVAAFIGSEGAGISRRLVPAAIHWPHVVREESEGPKPYGATFQELIGIAMHKIPGAYKANYITDTVSGMDKTKSDKIPFRKLDDFEAAALKKLVAGRDLVTDEQPGKLRLVGAIRASGDCMICHNCKERDLLGAFTYVLTPASKIPEGLRGFIQPDAQAVAPPKASVQQQSSQF